MSSSHYRGCSGADQFDGKAGRNVKRGHRRIFANIYVISNIGLKVDLEIWKERQKGEEERKRGKECFGNPSLHCELEKFEREGEGGRKGDEGSGERDFVICPDLGMERER